MNWFGLWLRDVVLLEVIIWFLIISIVLKKVDWRLIVIGLCAAAVQLLVSYLPDFFPEAWYDVAGIVLFLAAGYLCCALLLRYWLKTNKRTAWLAPLIFVAVSGWMNHVVQDAVSLIFL